MRRHSRACPGHPLPGPGADPPGRATALRRVRQGDRPRSGDAPRSRLAVHVRPLPEGIGLPRDREFARLRAGTGRQWLRRALHPPVEENLLWVRTFKTIEELRQALLAFRETYNTTWLVERHGFLTPAQFRQRTR